MLVTYPVALAVSGRLVVLWVIATGRATWWRGLYSERVEFVIYLVLRDGVLLWVVLSASASVRACDLTGVVDSFSDGACLLHTWPHWDGEWFLGR